MNKTEQVLQYFGKYKPTKLHLIPTWKWGLYRIQIDDYIVDFRFVDGCNPVYAIQLAIDEIWEAIGDELRVQQSNTVTSKIGLGMAKSHGECSEEFHLNARPQVPSLIVGELAETQTIELAI
jgi:hypothetical protein